MLNYFSDIFPDDNSEVLAPTTTLTPSAGLESTLSVMPINVTSIINTTIQCCTDYCKCLEHERTERERISAQLEVKLKEIESAKECIMQHLANQQQKWNDICRWIDKTLDYALTHDDRKIVAQCMTLAIVGYQSSDDSPKLIDTKNPI